MTTRGKTRARLGMLTLAVTVLSATGCGTQRAGDAADTRRSPHPTPTAMSTPSTPVDFTCPGESPGPEPTGPASATPTSTELPVDHYAENHGFRVPLPLHGQNRCKGLATVARVKHALEPLRERGDFAPDSVRGALTGLGYSAEKVQAYQNGSTGVGFLIDIGVSPWCVEGTMSSDSTKADAFGGYPDGSDCEPPSGGH
ncbi:superantigen-like protein SSL4 [Streptomyces triticiradicis]|uniref:Lipoprotein n=1 Tax=Streptomyces triticiradicis TaxID=2651189 RepID=A0A7J5D8Z9_9ACTN|nr:hypothetical protein [Streptomyces triticiradicis]KAB1981169.1 hypothetical protein F8144_32660 [Streptomyces triticiradicis]